jgi:SAM-dependent methyltransferase
MYLLASIPDCKRDSLLVVGPRFEPELLMARGLGWDPTGVRGIDTFSYSPQIDVGDMHNLPYEDGSFSAIVCGWTLSYSSDPRTAASEMHRVLSPGGYLVISMQKVSEDYEETLPGVLRGSDRIQTLTQLDELFPSLSRVVGFEPEVPSGAEGHTLAAYRKS